MYPTLNRQGFERPAIWLTASTIGDYKGCERLIVMESFFRHNGSYTNGHLKFGTALGAAGAAIALTWDGDNLEETLKQALIASMPFPAGVVLGRKSLETLWVSIYMILDQWRTMYDAGWRALHAERQALVRITFPSGVSGITGGSSDLLIQHHSGVRRVIDFKTASSNFNSSWEYGTQPVWYTLLDSITTNHMYYVEPMFWVFTYKANTKSVTDARHMVEATACISGIVGNLALLERLCSVVDNADMGNLPALWEKLITNPRVCGSGNFKCFRHAQCHLHEPINWAAPRENYQQTDIIDVTSGELLERISKLVKALGQQEESDDFDSGDFLDSDLFN